MEVIFLSFTVIYDFVEPFKVTENVIKTIEIIRNNVKYWYVQNDKVYCK